jgi:hypothetical protein
VTFRYVRKQRLGTVQMGHVPSVLLGGGGGYVLPPLFGWDSFTSGVSQLPETLNLNGVDITASLFYVGNDASPTEWVARRGVNLPITGAGANPIVGQLTQFSDGTRSVAFAGTGNNYYECADTTTGNMGGANAVIVCVFYNDPDDTGAYLLASKKAGLGTGNAGWMVTRQSATQCRFVLANGLSGGELSATRSVVAGWNILVVITNANGSSAWGQVIAAGTFPGTFSNPPVGPWDGSAPLRIGGGSAMSTFNRRIAFLGQWVGNFLPADASATAIMNDINKGIQQRLTGVYPQYFGGSPLCADATRTSAAYCFVNDGADTVAEYVCTHQPRVGRAAASVAGTGYVGERAATNQLFWSQDLANAEWTKINGGITSVAVGPDRFNSMQEFTSSAANAVHGVSQTRTLTALPYTFEFFFRPRDKQWGYLDISTLADVWAYFDLANGAVGSTGASVLGAGLERWTSTLWRCWITFNATAAAHTHRALWATGDGGVVYAGGTVDGDLGWAQSINIPGPLTHVRTTTAATTRSTDTLNYAVAGNYPTGVAPRTVVTSFAAKPYTPFTLARFVSAIVDGATEFEYIIATASVKAQTQATVASVGQYTLVDAGPTQVLDDNIHTVRNKSTVGDVVAYVDGAPFGAAAPAALPTPSRIYFAGSTPAASKLSGIVTSYRIYDQAVAPGEQGTGNDT